MKYIHKQSTPKNNIKRSRHHWRKRVKKNGSSLKLKKVMLLLSLFILTPLLIYASDIKGRFYISDYFSRDSIRNNFHILTSRLKLYKQEEEKPGFSFKFDGEIRKKIFNGDIYKNIPEERFNEVWLAYKFPGQQFNVSVGRQFIYELYNTYIDGLNAKYEIKKGMGLGVFGGLAPDKYDNSFNTKFRSFGIYGFLDRDKYRFDLGYENLSYKGKTDREYFSMRFDSTVSDKVRVNALSSASINQITKNPEIENMNASVSYAYSKSLRFQFFYDYYRAIKYFESSKQFLDPFNRDYFLDTNSQTRTGVQVDYNIAKGLNVYASTAYQKRKIDNKNAVRYTAGFRKYGLFGFDLSGRYTHIDNFTSTSNEFNADLSRNLFNTVDVSVYASKEKEKLDIEGGFTTGVFTYGASVYWPISKNYYASMFIERYQGDDYYNTSLFTQLGYRF